MGDTGELRYVGVCSYVYRHVCVLLPNGRHSAIVTGVSADTIGDGAKALDRRSTGVRYTPARVQQSVGQQITAPGSTLAKTKP